MILFDDDHIQCIYVAGGDGILLITFNEVGIVANNRNFWAEQPIRKLGISSVGFMSKRPNWFPSASVRKAAEVIDRTIGNNGSKRIIYGFSQGGYASVKYSKILSADISISVSPQYSINPIDLEDKRFLHHYDADIHNDMRIVGGDVSSKVYLFYDGNDLDRDHAHAIQTQVDGCRVFPMKHTGHATIRGMAGSAKLRSLLDATLADDHAKLKALSAGWRRDNPFRLSFAILHLLQRHPAAAARIAMTNVGRIPENFVTRISFQLAIKGFSEFGMTFMPILYAQKPHHAGIACTYALVLDLAGRLDDGVAVMAAISEVHPANAQVVGVRTKLELAKERIMLRVAHG